MRLFPPILQCSVLYDTLSATLLNMNLKNNPIFFLSYEKSAGLNLQHYSKSQILVQKFNFDKTPTLFTSFSPNFFLTIFLVKSKLSTAKKSKTTTFSRVFHPKNSTIFSGNQS